MMKSYKRVFIISQYFLFQDGLKSLIDQQGEVELVGWTANPAQAIDQIQVLQPDVVILDSTGISVSTMADLVRILQACPETKVINVNLHSNYLSIYQRVKQRAMTSSYYVLGWKVENFTDLLKAIRGSSCPPSPATIILT